MKSNQQYFDLVKTLTLKKLTISTAESLTGGMVGELITQIPGASNVYKGGIIAYQTKIKNIILNTSSSIAVSENTAKEMAINTKKLFESDIGLSTTGVAGPDPQDGIEPGTVFIGVSFKDNIKVEKITLDKSLTREAIREETCKEANKLLLNILAKI